jgi:hypothetical protein
MRKVPEKATTVVEQISNALFANKAASSEKGIGGRINCNKYNKTL